MNLWEKAVIIDIYIYIYINVEWKELFQKKQSWTLILISISFKLQIISTKENFTKNLQRNSTR